MKQDREQWINDVMDSMDGLKADPKEGLFEKIQMRLQKPTKIISMKTAFAAAASIALLVTLNIVFLSGARKQSGVSDSSDQSIQSYYNTLPTDGTSLMQ